MALLSSPLIIICSPLAKLLSIQDKSNFIATRAIAAIEKIKRLYVHRNCWGFLI